jgi:hypothetical protein
MTGRTPRGQQRRLPRRARSRAKVKSDVKAVAETTEKLQAMHRETTAVFIARSPKARAAAHARTKARVKAALRTQTRRDGAALAERMARDRDP